MSGAVESIVPSLAPAPFPVRKSSLTPLRIPQPDSQTDAGVEGGKSPSKPLESKFSSQSSSPSLPNYPRRESSLSPLPRQGADLWKSYPDQLGPQTEEIVSDDHNDADDYEEWQSEKEETGPLKHANAGRQDVLHTKSLSDTDLSLAGKTEAKRQDLASLADGKENRKRLSASINVTPVVSQSPQDDNMDEGLEISKDKFSRTDKGTENDTLRVSKLRSSSVNPSITVLKEKEATPGIRGHQRPHSSAGSPTSSPDASTRRSRAPASLSSRLRRRSWMPSSRSPSPKKRAQVEDVPDIPTIEAGAPPGTERKDRLNTIIQTSNRAPQKPTSFSKQLTNKLRRRQSSFTTLDTLTDQSPASKLTDGPIIPKSYSDDKLPSAASSIMTTRSSDRLSGLIQPSSFSLSSRSRQAKKRDELWSGFRDLENASGRFQSKTGEQKANVVRIALPFLQETAFHPSNFNLHIDDLNRRLFILYNWWVALLEFAKSRNFATITSQSKSVILDAITEIMERPEWKHYPSPFSPVVEKGVSDNVSESTSENEYIVESVQHDISNWFSQCLLTQMTFVIDKMSLRSAPSLVTFCAKTCAYAYIFCPGIAGVLIRLWNLRYFTLKRVMEENGIDTSKDYRDVAERISSTLPPAMKELHFSTLQETHKSIRKQTSYPLGTQDSEWKGPWVDRWSGQESELFYTFVKHYYLLLSQYLPLTSKTERLVAAGGIFIQAQILVNIDATIHKCFPKPLDLASLPPIQNKNPVSRVIEEDKRTASMTFDDMLNDMDSAPPSVAFAGINLNHNAFGNLTNADRSMSENRLILLLKDMLAIRNNTIPKAVRESFAYMFVDLLRAAAKATQQFNRLETDTLCTFLEETVVTLVRYERTHAMITAFLDWEFWFGVWKIMAQNNYFATETRIYSLIYSFWPAIALDADRKAELCYGFLLDREHFESRFNHWSPMVRAYFMRLLCWRVARIGEDGDVIDLKILACLHQRLKSIHAHYLHLQQTAVENELIPPSTVPALSAPSRRFVIIRADRPSPLLAAFDTSVSNAIFKRSLFIEQLCSPDFVPDSGEDDAQISRPDSAMSGASTDEDMEDSPKRWTGGGLLRSIIGPSKSNNRSKSQSPSRAENDALVRPPTSTPDNRRRSGSLMSGFGSAGGDELVTTWRRQQSSLFRPYCFRFSLEMVDRRMPAPSPMTLHIPRLPQPAQTLLMRYLRSTAMESPGSTGSSSENSISSDNASSRTSASRLSDERAVEEFVEESRPVSTWLPPAVAPRLSDTKASRELGTYCGRALAEWSVIVNETHLFFERRKAEGVPGNRYVETPLLGVAESARGPRG